MDKNSFMFAILNDPSLSKKDRERVISLITRDIENDLMTQTRQLIREEIENKHLGVASSSNVKKQSGIKDKVKKGWHHSPKIVNYFLRKFSTDPILRFAVHSWDQGEFSGYRGFLERINKCLEGDPIYKDLYFYNIGLYYTLRSFLLCQEDRDFNIPGENRLRIGLQHPFDVIDDWMDKNSEKRLAEMPMTVFPPEYRPPRLNGRSIGNMEDLIDYFKHLIEFRDSDFEDMIFDTFNNADFSPVIDDSVKGISFYTYTRVVKNFLICVLGNIKNRIHDGAPKTVKVFIKEINKHSFELHVLHEGSFAQKSINNEKLSFGNLASWRLWKGGSYDSLTSICDYAVESMFFQNDKSRTPHPYRIDYLYPRMGVNSIDGTPRSPKVTPLEEDVAGFEYIMRFYK